MIRRFTEAEMARHDAEVRGRVAEEIAQAIEGLTGSLICEWTQVEAAAEARDRGEA